MSVLNSVNTFVRPTDMEASMMTVLNSHDAMNTLINIGAMGVFVAGMVAFYFALTYVPRTLSRRKR